MDAYQFGKWTDHFIRILRDKDNLSITERHLLVLNGHKAHLTLEVVQKVKRNGIDLLTISFYTSHGLQPLDVLCFKPYKNILCVKNHGVKVKKEELAN